MLRELKAPDRRRGNRLRLDAKRLFDIAGSLVGLVAALPVMVVVAIAVRVVLGSPVLFRQVRPGKHAVPFELVKFRTMRAERLGDGTLQSDGSRLTRLGKFLRSTSLDELPELWNVLRGDMSLVGPRPLLMQYLPYYNEEQARRHLVRPGITGWAQINGRNGISWEEKFRLDVWYVDNQSFALDLRILVLTLVKVLSRDGVNQAGHATVEYFRGGQ